MIQSNIFAVEEVKDTIKGFLCQPFRPACTHGNPKFR